MFFYYSLISYCIITTQLIKDVLGEKKKTLLGSVMIVLCIIASFRNVNVGNDTREYIRLFELSNSPVINQNLYSRYEFGYIWLNKFVGMFTHNPNMILVVTSIFIFFGYSLFMYKYSKNIGLSMILFVLMGYFAQTMNTIRFQLALVILLYSFDMLIRKEKIKFLLIVLLAFSFHKTALIFLIAYPTSHLKLNTKNTSIFCIITAVIFIFFDKINEKIIVQFFNYSSYLSSDYYNSGVKLATVIYIAITLSILAFCLLIRKYKGVSETEEIMIVMLLIGISILILSLKFNLLDRVSDYFKVYSLILVPNFLLKIRDKYKRFLYSSSIVILFTLYFVFIHLKRPEWNMIYPYETWLGKW